MDSLITGGELTAELEQKLPQSSQVTVISAFVTSTAIRWIKKQPYKNTPKITIVGRFIPSDFVSGSSSLDAIDLGIKSGYTIKALSNLHAKIYQVDDCIFTGSANMTGKGLKLVENGNLEACTKVETSSESLKFIEMIVESGIKITADILAEMSAFLSTIEKVPLIPCPNSWPENILPINSNLYVSDFPLAPPGELNHAYSSNPSLEFALMLNEFSNFSEARKLFKCSKSYNWIMTILNENRGQRDLSFGHISKLLHDALCDDPAPYRKDVKELLTNLFKFIELYANEEITIYRPRYSQIIRLN